MKYKIYLEKFSGEYITPIMLYEAYVKNEIGGLLESKDLENARYSIIFKNPNIQITGHEDILEIKENCKIKDSLKGNLFTNLQSYLNKYNFENNKFPIPFCSGFIGAFSYDTIRQNEIIPDNNVDMLNIPDVNGYFIDNCIVYDHYHDIYYVVVLELANKEGKIKAHELIDKTQKDIKNSLKHFSYEVKNTNKKKNPINYKSNFTKNEYEDIVRKAKEYIKAGDIFQVVLSQRFEVSIQEDAFSLYRKLRRINPSPYLFYINYGEYQVLGSSPETLVNHKDGEISTWPIAGTRPRGKDEEEDEKIATELLADIKETAEHVMLVDLSRNDMGKIAKIGSVNVPIYKQVKNFSHVMHIVSEVTGKLRTKLEPIEILKSFLPAGTLSGAPKIRAMEIIDELENVRRNVYGGAIGYIDLSGNMDFCIAIRMMIVKNSKAYMQAGAGIVADSSPSSEYEECHNKAMALLKSLEEEE